MHGNVRDRALLDLAYADFQCHLTIEGVCEGEYATCEPCHSNQSKHGKGGGMKAHDCFYVPGCRSCHVAFDQGCKLTLEERRELWDAAYWEFLPKLFNRGLIGVLKKVKRI
jgi:hypothetical protein